MINDHLISQLDFLLNSEQEETVASMTLKLVAVLFQISKVFIKRFLETCQLSSIFKHYNESSSVNVLKATQLVINSGYLKEADLINLLPITEKILRHYVNSGQ